MRARAWVATTVVLVALAAVAVAGEVVVRERAQRQLTDDVAAALGADPATTHVDLGGGLVLAQLARGRLDHVELTTSQVVLDRGTFTDVTARATDVAVNPPHTAATLDVTGVVPPQTVRDRLAERGLDLDVVVHPDGAPDGSGSLVASGSTLGVGWGLTLVPRVADAHLLVDVVAADLGGLDVQVDELPAGVRDAVSGLEVPLDGLPAGLVLRTAHVVPGGVALELGGTDVALDAAR